jgi:glutaconyl-CoA/methylmalonyl-CoA decarboxylase subunit gamma
VYRYEVDLGGQRLTVELVQRGQAWEARVGDRMHRLRLVGGGAAGEALAVEVDGERLELSLGQARVRQAPLPKLPAATAGPKRGANLPVPSPMAGVVQDILVKPGQVVQRGDRLLVLEAMKMENTIHAPASGRVADLAVHERKTVLKGEPLMQLQPVEEMR